MKDNISPEEKLLRLIKGQKKEAAASAKKDPELTAETKPHDDFSLPNPLNKYFSQISPRMVIMVIFAASCVYLGIAFLSPGRFIKELAEPEALQEKTPETKKEPQAQAKPLEFYLEGTSSRRIFTHQDQVKSESPQDALNAGLSKDLNLIGIISGDNPQAVIEDKKTQKTYYLNKGQFIGDFQIEDIRDGKIILNRNSQKYELYL